MSLDKLRQTKREEIRQRVALTPGWAILWYDSKIPRRDAWGTNGRGVPVDRSQCTVTTSIYTCLRFRLELTERTRIEGQVFCCSAKTFESTTGGEETAPIRDGIVVGG